MKMHPEALESLKRYKDDLKAGHTSAAEYWRGQAGAYFTANPITASEALKLFEAEAYKARKEMLAAKPSKKQALTRRYYDWQSGLEVANEIYHSDAPDALERIMALKLDLKTQNPVSANSTGQWENRCNPTDLTNLAGKLYLNTKTGDVEMKYGAGNWHTQKLGNIKSYPIFQRILDSYGKPEGKKIRMAAAAAIMKNIKYANPTGYVLIKSTYDKHEAIALVRNLRIGGNSAKLLASHGVYNVYVKTKKNPILESLGASVVTGIGLAAGYEGFALIKDKVAKKKNPTPTQLWETKIKLAEEMLAESRKLNIPGTENITAVLLANSHSLPELRRAHKDIVKKNPNWIYPWERK
jgi:hypothetical protein